MIFETTLSINEKVKSHILDASFKSGKSACFISKLLIKKAIKLNENISVINQLIEYQRPEMNSALTTFRYRLSENERIQFSSARQRLNISISMLLLVGFILFFDDIMNELSNIEILQNSYTIVLLYSKIQIIDFLKKIKVYEKLCWKLE